jgi:ribosomal-protein-alanine N-acetyltransferase
MRDLSADDAGLGGRDTGAPVRYWIDRLEGDADLDGVLDVESESFTNPWTREMYTWELQNRSVCHIFVARTPECAVAGFCAFWLVLDEIHINNVAVRPPLRGVGIGSALLHHVLAEAKQLGARRATLEGARVERVRQAVVRTVGLLRCGHSTELLHEARRGCAHPLARRACLSCCSPWAWHPILWGLKREAACVTLRLTAHVSSFKEVRP